jgi:hypothetical protein
MRSRYAFIPKVDVPILIRLQLEWKNPDVDGLIQFLVTEKGFK